MKKNKHINLDELSLSFDNLLSNRSNEDFIKKLRTILKKRYHKKRIIFLRDARTALYKSLSLLGLNGSDEVIIPAYTSKPVLTAVKQICKPVFVDINTDNASMNLEEISNKISPKTKAIILTNTYGKSEDISEIVEITDKKDIEIIEDLAQSPWGRYNGRNLGTYGKYTVLSFAPCKDLTCFTGGALLCDEELPKYKSISWIYSYESFFGYLLSEICDKLKSISPSRKIIYKLLYEKRIVFERNRLCSVIKERDEITNFMAYLLYNQIKDFDFKIKSRRKNAEYYVENLKPGIMPQKEIDLKNYTYYMFTVHVKRRDELYNQGLKHGIAFGKSYDYYLAPLPNSVKASQMNLNIPVHSKLTDQDRERIIKFINMSV